MKHIAAGFAGALLVMAASQLLSPAVAHAESLRAKVQQEQTMDLPKRGMTMAEVRKDYGEPLKVLPTRGGSSRYQPPIHRWEYATYIVYFEYSHVIHSVVRTPGSQAS